ncbi:hypothetical protein L5470_08450 [Synechococcus sp. PCC 6717]|jgi:hypothetical protein|uniref:Uncharacterized protein n=1 Tax=Parathermosynechococcus lividus PCC 6715 TaxID=1917166 RepID=A0A2D2Q530_PARLV|nr:hypothetical protein [Thermostichus lividus]ATS19347.1 hypothetical protein BRW62_12090 [Thermostichus lividus PCC 6715]MCH9056686.1 hypothetical protein [Synechococcus sp. PCC 6716]MCI3281006.1 hypothetical protein [Synechococcus sp. PCC 6717]
MAELVPSPKLLEPEGVYLCPVCRHGQIAPMVLMDTYACNFCRHILSIDLTHQTARLEDTAMVFRWQWTGTTWRSLNTPPVTLTYTAIVLGVLLITLPPGLVWLGQQMFPPLSGDRWHWFPLFWVGLTFFAHAVLVLRIFAGLAPVQPLFGRDRHR